MRTTWIILVMAMTCSANAGPWLRSDGEGFMSVDSIGSIGRNQGDLSSYNSIFWEFGVSDETTLGFNAGQDHAVNRNATAYLRRSLSSPDANWAISYDIGLGAAFSADATNPHLRLGFSIGRGQLFPEKAGWAQADAIALIHAQSEISFKLETTLGRKGTKEWLYLIQAIIERPSQNPWKLILTPSIAIPTKQNRHMQFGLSASTEDGGRYGIKAAFWRHF